MMKLIKSLAIASVIAAPAFSAAADEAPIISFHTNIYETYGATNSFHITLGATEDTYVDVDYGFGLTEELIGKAEFDSDAGGMVGTSFSITVSQEGMVKIYGDASKIDFIDFEGCYISDISFPELTNVQILNLKHNELKALDLSHMTNLMALYLDDNPFSKESPLVIGGNKPNLAIISMAMTDWVSPSFNISDYPQLASLQAYASPSITAIDPTGCPKLLQLTIDGTNVKTLDVSQNPNLLILNVSETQITELDLSQNPYLTELYAQHEALYNGEYKIRQLDITKNPELQRLYLNGNALTELDLTKCPKLVSFSCRRNNIKALNFDNCPNMTLVDISLNDMTFTTMPLPRTTFSDYAYAQNPIKVNRQYAENTVFDFTDAVVRGDSQTDAVLFTFNRDNPATPTILDDEYFTFAEGKFTVNKAYGDSVYIAFHNTAFPDFTLTTTPFIVKEEANMNQPTNTITLTTSLLAENQALFVGLDGATADEPKKFMVDFGDGNLVEFTATTSGIPAEANATGERGGSKTRIYVPEGVDLTAFKIDGLRLNGAVTVDKAPMLRELQINNCNLASINLKWNRCLTKLDLSNNALTVVDLSEPNSGYIKTMLGDINLSNNKIATFVTVDPYGLRHLNLANNLLTSVVTEHATGLIDLDISNNKIAELSITDCEVLQTLNAQSNLISELYIPDYAPLKSVNIADNAFSIPALPLPGFCADYTYAPQKPMTIPSKAPSANLTAQNFTTGNGDVTSFTWRYAADSTEVPEGNIRVNSPGRFFFTNPNTGLIYCEMTHPAFPDLAGENALRTTNIQTADVPDKAFAQFTTSSEKAATIVMAAKAPNTVVYVDWSSNGDFEEYILDTTYTTWNATTYPGATVKCYSYEENDGVTVFSVRNADLESIDVSSMKSLYCFGISGSKIDFNNIKFPASSLTEFIADGCGFTELDLAPLASVSYLQLSNNKLTSLDLSPLKNLANLYASGNQLTSVKFDNPRLWDLGLSVNLLETIDFTGAPAVSQLYLSHNKLSDIDITSLKGLKVLFLDGNYFDIQSLPLKQDDWAVYNYVNQNPLDVRVEGGVVDLSRQAERNGVKTAYTWYIDTPYFDEEGNLQGEDLFVDEEYTIEGGVTKFLKPFQNVMCVMTNDLFPNLYLYTPLMNVEAASVEDVVADIENGEATYYDLQGRIVANPSAGIYIRRQGDTATKVIIR